MSADGTQNESDEVVAARQELKVIRARMERLEREAAIEVEAGWQTQWRSPDVFALKVQTRLTMNTEYRSLQEKVRAAETVLDPTSGTVTGGGGMSLSDW